MNRELKIKTELRADNAKEIIRLQDKINVNNVDRIKLFYFILIFIVLVSRRRITPNTIRTHSFDNNSRDVGKKTTRNNGGNGKDGGK